MSYYALQVKTGEEELFIKRALISFKTSNELPGRLIFPRRMLPVRRRGITKPELSPIFPGYLFFESELLPSDFSWQLRTTQGFFRILPDTKTPKPLEGADLATLRHFISIGDIAEGSKVHFDENNRIHVIEGPLKGLEGRIIKVDKRKRRAKVKLDLYDESFLIDLSFEIMDKH